MPAHPRVKAWIAQNYRKPVIDQEWLADCSDWIASEFGLDPDRNFDEFVQHVESQLLQSNLADSTVHGSGVDPLLFASRPSNARRPAPRQKKTTGPMPLLVEVKSITEIAHSAFSLLNTHQTRLDRADLGLAHEENVDQRPDEDEGPIPKFPRGMLKFELWDGSTTFRAIEFRSLPQLELGTTPLGYKLFLKSTPVRNGVAYLEPENVTLKGHRTEDHDVSREQVFLSSLRRRLGRPDPPSEEPVVAQPRANSPVQPARQRQATPVNIDEMFVDDDVDPDVLREMTLQMDEAIEKGTITASTLKKNPTTSSNTKPALRINTAETPSIKTPSSVPPPKTSSYFTAQSSTSTAIPDIGLSPRPANIPDPGLDSDVPWDIDDVKPSGILDKKPSKTFAQSKRVKTRSPSLDPYDELSFDMDVDDSFLEQVGMIEQSALGPGNNMGKTKVKDAVTEDTSHSGASGRKLPAKRVLAAEPSIEFLEAPLDVKWSTMAGHGTKSDARASSLSGSTETPTISQSSAGRHLFRDPSFIVISSEDEDGGRGTTKPPRRRAVKEMSQDVEDSDVIDISD